MRVELHCHSTCSDGSFSPAEVAARAARRGVELFCLTDHDTHQGAEDTARVLEGQGCRVLTGLELSCRAYGRNVHLLVYGLQPGPGLEALSSRLEDVHAIRCRRIVAICERLAGLGIEIDADAILIRSHGRTPGRPDVARALVEKGVCSSFEEAFTRFLRDGGPADVPIDRVSIEEGLELGRAAGAKMSLAHPHTLSEYALVKDLFVRLRDAGLQGLEAYYGKYGPAEREGWLRLARELDLVVTGGSDFHGELSPTVPEPVIDLPEPHAARLREWLA